MQLSGGGYSGSRSSKCKGPEVGPCLERLRKRRELEIQEYSEQGV